MAKNLFHLWFVYIVSEVMRKLTGKQSVMLVVIAPEYTSSYMPEELLNAVAEKDLSEALKYKNENEIIYLPSDVSHLIIIENSSGTFNIYFLGRGDTEAELLTSNVEKNKIRDELFELYVKSLSDHDENYSHIDKFLKSTAE